MSTSLLSEEQRIALQAAIQEKQSTKGAAVMDKHLSRNRNKAGVVKRGGTGRFNWGDPVRDSGFPSNGAIDRHDPNYSSSEEVEAAKRHRNRKPKASDNGHEGPSSSGPLARADSSASRAADVIQNFKRGVQVLLAEYFDSGDIQEVALSLEESGLPRLFHAFVKRAMVMSLDRHDREREMVSVLLSALYSDVIAPDQMQRGFLDAVDQVEDLRLDSPNAVELLANFVARATVDDILPPSFLSRCRDLVTPSRGPELAELIKRAETLLTGRHTAERNLRCWGAGAGLLLDETKAAVQSLVSEFLASRDLQEADRRLRELSCPFFHHELVKVALLALLQNPSTNAQPVKALLRALSDSGLVSASQLEKGLQRVVDNLDDLTLDYPQARAVLLPLIPEAKEEGWLDADFSGSPTATIAHSNGSGSIAASALASPATLGGPASEDRKDAKSVHVFKDRIKAIVLEYFDSADVENVRVLLEEQRAEGLHHLFVKKAVSMALDRGGREKELVAELISGLFPNTLTRAHISLGFTLLLDAAEDLTLDVPDALHQISLFLGRAIVDEVIPPVFLTQVVDRLRDGALGLEALQSVAALLGLPHCGEIFETCFVNNM